jgi:hypothetical protein
MGMGGIICFNNGNGNGNLIYFYYCISSSCSKRGQCRDADIAEMFTDREERDLRKKVLERTEKKLKQILGIKVGKKFK